MSGYLAVDAALRDAPSDWKRTTFKRITIQIKIPNVASDQPLLSLASTGVVSARQEMGGLGRQAPSVETIKSYWKVRPDHVVVNPMWLVGGSVGVSDVAGAVSPAYRVYKVNPGVHPRYIHHLLRTYPFMEQYRLLGRGDTTFDRSVGREDFEGLPLALPPLEGQRRIADFLDDQVATIDRAIALRGKQTALLVELLDSHARSLLVDPEAPLTAGAPVRRFVTRVQTGGTPRADESWVWTEDMGIGWYGPGSFSDRLRLASPPRQVQPTAVTQRIVPCFPAGSVLLVGIGATAGGSPSSTTPLLGINRSLR